jgi:hypothetical protein
MVFCPNEHDNLAGLSECKVCGLPLLDLSARFDSLAESLASRAPMGRNSPRTVLIGLGTSGAGLVDIARAGQCESLPDHTYLAIDARGTGPEVGSPGVLRLLLGSQTATAGTFCGIGEALVRDDPGLAPVLRKAGLGRPDNGQIVFLVAAVGGGIGSALSVLAEKSRQLNPECYTVALVVVPGREESFHNRLNAYYGLSRLLETPAGHAADLVVAVHYDRMKKIRGVGTSAEELRTEGLLAAFSELMINNLSSQRISEVVRINRSMGVTLVVPCLALGRSLEIFGDLRNILDSAISFPANGIAKQAVLVCHLLLRVPESRAASFSEETVGEELAALVREHLPYARSTSLSITFSTEQHDRVDACLLLGGDSARSALFADGTDLSGFEEELARQVSWETYGIRKEDMDEANTVLIEYDFALERARVKRRRTGQEPGTGVAQTAAATATGQSGQPDPLAAAADDCDLRSPSPIAGTRDAFDDRQGSLAAPSNASRPLEESRGNERGRSRTARKH